MDLQEALEILDRAFKENQQKPLNDTEILVFEGSWNKKTYEEIADEFAKETNRYYSSNYLKQDVGPKLWNRISQVLKKSDSDSSMRVSKNKLRTATQRLKQLQEQNRDNQNSSNNQLETAVFIITSNNIELQEMVAKISDFIAELKKASQDSSLEYREIREGSVIVVLQGSVKGFERLQALFRNGELTEILGFPIESIELESIEPVDTREWLESLFNESWQPPETVLATTSVRSSKTNAEASQIRVSKAKVISLTESQSVVTIVRFTPVSDEEIQVSLEIYPDRNNAYLPEGLIIEIIDERQAIAIRKEVESYIDSIQIPFGFEPQEQFKIKLTLENISITEMFNN